jgi:hypothetical protein
MKKVIIAGSASLEKEISCWKNIWENEGYDVLNYPRKINDEEFFETYPDIHKKFLKDIASVDIFFLMNEDQKGIAGYIGAQSFSEMSLAVYLNRIHNRNIDILILKMPEDKVQSYEEISLWLKLGWIKIYPNEKNN